MTEQPRQLTIDGGEVSHPPPRPKAMCPECEKLIALNDGGEFRHHGDEAGEQCPMSGRRPWEADQ
jgi:hypothetical protein